MKVVYIEEHTIHPEHEPLVAAVHERLQGPSRRTVYVSSSCLNLLVSD
jgi:hypothetical protein